jgi:DNA-binding SARP family transcriptional activator
MEFHVLGPLDVIRHGERLRLGPAKQRALLAILLLRANRAIPKNLLIDALWGAAPPPSAEKNIYVYVCNLRKVLGHDRIVRRVHGYLVTVHPGELDLDRFEEALRAGSRALAAGTPEQARALLEDALACWSDRPLADLPHHPYLQAESLRLDDRRMTALESKIDADLRLGRHHEVCDELSALVAEHPLRERLRAQHMIALFRAGRRAEALASYDAARRYLAAELGLEPGPLLTRLHGAVLEGTEPPEEHGGTASARPAATPRASAGGPPVNTAVAGTGVTGSPVTGSPITGSEPSARSPGGFVPAQLPRGLPDFTGRRDALSRLSVLLGERAAAGRGSGAVIAITGPAGTGKSALAIHFAHRIRDQFPDGQLYVELSSATGPSVPHSEAVKQLLAGISPLAGVPATDAAAAAKLRSELADRKVQIVLDGAVSEEQVRSLLPGGENCLTLITSRIPLDGIPGANRIRLTTLPPHEALALLTAQIGPSRVNAEPEHAQRIVDYCGALPLALRIAGARLHADADWDLGRFAARLADEAGRLDELVAGDLSVRASLDHSYTRLFPEEKAVLGKLAEAGLTEFGTPMGVAVSGLPSREAGWFLEQLAHRGMLDATGRDAAGQPRYRLPTLTLLYLREQGQLRNGGSLIRVNPGAVTYFPPVGRAVCAGSRVRDVWVVGDAALGEGGRATVDGPDRAGDEAGRPGREQQADALDLVRLTGAAHRHGAQPDLAVVLGLDLAEADVGGE